jgi:hypothetical protein
MRPASTDKRTSTPNTTRCGCPVEARLIFLEPCKHNPMWLSSGSQENPSRALLLAKEDLAHASFCHLNGFMESCKRDLHHRWTPSAS